MDKVIWFTDTFGIKTNGDFFQRVRIEDGKSVTCVTDTFGGMHFTERGRVVILLDYRTAIWYAYDTVKDEELATGIGFCAYNDVVGLIPDLLCTTNDVIVGNEGIRYMFKRFGGSPELLRFLTILYPNVTFYNSINI